MILSMQTCTRTMSDEILKVMCTLSFIKVVSVV